jgi:gas vesicle protein
METSNHNGKLIGALLLGAAIGGTLGILFAPLKGSETRKNLSTRGNDLTDALKDKFNDFLDQFKKDVDKAKDHAGEFVENGTHKAEKPAAN